MARIQILELPTVCWADGTEETPFAVVIDQVETLGVLADIKDATAKLGARAILVFEEAVEIPANEVPVDPDGYPLKIRVEGDFGAFREQVQAEIAKAQAEVTGALNLAHRA